MNWGFNGQPPTPPPTIPTLVRVSTITRILYCWCVCCWSEGCSYPTRHLVCRSLFGSPPAPPQNSLFPPLTVAPVGSPSPLSCWPPPSTPLLGFTLPATYPHLFGFHHHTALPTPPSHLPFVCPITPAVSDQLTSSRLQMTSGVTLDDNDMTSSRDCAVAACRICRWPRTHTVTASTDQIMLPM